ncbi:phosphotransferase enzyme family protein [Aurantiacibacter rhizosphaerae]|uniref:Phosphotransferase n=1 Tax=Aurantiacibacter rhizosphaerae TaxID=2691582 RepID=A0A844XI84_9SPHN|nr:phosphotransferase [Aurantiacibacter rhizosphaerae]MWV29258.1 phosphotransferase [Aurantiacibacter rhizosphaerae]
MADGLAIESYTGAAHAAAEAFGVEVAALDPISISENVVFRLREAGTGQLYALRLHRPGYHALDTLESERSWTSALAAKGMIVPTGRRSASGNWYELVRTPDAAGMRYAGLTVWHEGQVLGSVLGSRRGPECLPWFEKLGSLLGEMHRHTASWAIPAGFARHRLDRDGLVGDTPFWGRFWQAGTLDNDERSLLSEVRKMVRSRLQELERQGAAFGLIHADAHLDNVLISGERLGLIDFDDCAFGWHAFDMAVALQGSSSHPDFAEIRDHFLAVYQLQQDVPPDIIQQIDLFLLIRELQLVGWRDARPENPENLDKAQWMPQLMQKIDRALGSV